MLNLLGSNLERDSCIGTRRMQKKTVTPTLTQGMDSETDGHDGVIIVALRCGESVVN